MAVVGATEVMNDRPCYEVEFSDGEVIVADGQHQWLTWTRAARRYDAQTRGFQRYSADPILPQVVTTEQIGSTLRCPTVDHRPNHAVQLASPLRLPEADLPIPPYALGVWAGDGSTDWRASRVPIRRSSRPWEPPGWSRSGSRVAASITAWRLSRRR